MGSALTPTHTDTTPATPPPLHLQDDATIGLAAERLAALAHTPLAPFLGGATKSAPTATAEPICAFSGAKLVA